MNSRLRAVLREPLVHFVALGGLVFAIGRFAGADRPEPDPRVIELTPEIRARLVDPDRVEAWVDEEMLYREALRLGLHEGDPVIRRRLVQKMEFIAQSGEPSPDPSPDPSEAELGAFLAEHAAHYAGAPRYDFVQLVVPSAADPDGAVARSLLAKLEAGAEPSALGRVGKSRRFTLDNVAGTFGRELATALPDLPRSRWALVELADGRAIVRLDSVEDGAVPPLSRVRNRVELDWKKARAQEAVQRALDELRSRYRVEEVP